MNVIRSRQHNLSTEQVNKIALSANDDKRIIQLDKIQTLAHGFRAWGALGQRGGGGLVKGKGNRGGQGQRGQRKVGQNEQKPSTMKEFYVLSDKH